MRRSERHLESRLRAERPQPSATFVETLAARTRRPAAFRPRFAFAGVLSATMLVALASVGGISYASNAARDAVRVVRQALVPAGESSVIRVFGINSGGDQYRPGFGFGDPNHNHTGPPGLTRSGGEAAPPIRARTIARGRAKTVAFRIRLDEQAALRIHVLAPNGKKLLITQKGTRLGAGLEGPQTKTLRYTVRVPRSIPISLRIPGNLVKPGELYNVRVIAIDPSGLRTTLLIPFIG